MAGGSLYAVLALAPRTFVNMQNTMFHNSLKEKHITKPTRSREHVKTVPNTLVLQECQHKSRQNHVVFQYNMLQMFCPRAFLEIIREPLDFKACAQITRSHLTSRCTRVGLACVQGMNLYQIIPYHAGHKNPHIAIGFLSSLRYSFPNFSTKICQIY